MAFTNTSDLATKFVTTTTVLTSPVANSGTFTLAYPSGTAQATFTGRRATTSGQQVVRNKNDVFGPAAVGLSYGSSNITVTNSTGVGWAIGDVLDFALAYVDTDAGVELTWFTAFTGKNGAGACTLTGAKVGARVMGVVNLSTPGDAASSFEGVITVADQIQQSSASNLSAAVFAVALGIDV